LAVEVAVRAPWAKAAGLAASRAAVAANRVVLTRRMEISFAISCIPP
jgi:hypothetical protein